MKFFKYIFLIALVGTLVSCEDYFGDIDNEDPDNPINVSPDVILPQVQLRLAYTYGGDFARYLGIYTQHVDGISRQFAVIGNYGIQPTDVDQMWANVYTGTLQSNKELLKQSIALGNNHYAGIALAIEAYTMMIATDVWGDMAYSDAFQFAENGGVYQPIFDPQQDIYDQIFANLNDARDFFSMDAGGSVPGGEDQMFGGDIDSWIKFCNAVEARGRIHLAKRDNGNYELALQALGEGAFESVSDAASVTFGTAATETAPWYQYIEQRDDCETGATYIAKLEELNDPRLATYGWPHDLDHPIWTRDQTLYLLSYAEQKFIEAEALLMTNNRPEAYDAYLEGIRASMEEAQVADGYDDYVAQPAIGVGSSNLELSNIITQKWLALYTSPEAHSDWRRTGLPELVPISGTAIPRRLPYAQTEIFSNPGNVPSGTTIFSRVWWDSE
jgi:hypothetical protein